jgi:hypothetical protein
MLSRFNAGRREKYRGKITSREAAVRLALKIRS